MCNFMCPTEPPTEVKGMGTRATAYGHMLSIAHNPHVFAVGLQDSCGAEPLCCLSSALGAPCGLTACWARQAVLDKYHGGIDDFVCFQSYIPACCCFDFPNMCRGSQLGLYLEGCCCPVFSLSIARIHLMDSKQMRPDPMDWQLIHCSNALQILSCFVDLAAVFVEDLRDLAHVIDLTADLFTCSVAGCMGAQIMHEIKNDANGVRFLVVEGVPVGGQVSGMPTTGVQTPTAYGVRVGAPSVDEMER